MIVAVVLSAALAASPASSSSSVVVYEQTLTATIGKETTPTSQASSTVRCERRRCHAARGAFGVYPRVDVYGDADSGVVWLVDPARARRAKAERFRPFDRLWFVDSALADALVEVDPERRPRPPLFDAHTTYWRADSDDVTLEVWVRPFDGVSDKLFASQLELRSDGAGKALARLPGLPIFVQHSVRRPPVPVVTRWTMTSLRVDDSGVGVDVPGFDVVDEADLVFAATPAPTPPPKPATTTGPSPWRRIGVAPNGRDVFADDDGVWVCDGDRCAHVGGAARADVAVPCAGFFSASARGRFFAVDCFDDRVFVVGLAGGARVVTADVASVAVDDDGHLTWLRRAGERDDRLVAARETATGTKTFALDDRVPDNGSSPDLGTGRVLAVTHALAGKDEAVFFVVDGKLVRRAIGGGGLINGDCLWISELKGGYTRLTPTTSTPLPKALLRGAAPPDGDDGLLEQTLPWGDRGLVVVYERRIDLLDRDLVPVRALPKSEGSVVAASPDGARVYVVDKGGDVSVADVSAALAGVAACAGP